jgi:uncharacterized protein YdeI (YjbR/CyaY-like superfamily)
MGGVFMLPVSAAVRESAGVAAGDTVDVEVQLDTEPREVPVPGDLMDALNRDSAARQCFEGLSFSNQQRLVLSLEGAKTSETRQRRLTSMMSKLRAGQI